MMSRFFRRWWLRATGVWCGYLSGFPWCCILFFYTYWVWARSPQGYRRWVHKHLKEHNCPEPKYILCPACTVEGRVVVPKDCRPWCFRHRSHNKDRS